jgi:hypothetical protein
VIEVNGVVEYWFYFLLAMCDSGKFINWLVETEASCEVCEC